MGTTRFVFLFFPSKTNLMRTRQRVRSLHTTSLRGDQVSGYRLVSTPGLRWRFQVARPDGLPDIGLTLFANDLVKSLSESSVPIYIREILGAGHLGFG